MIGPTRLVHARERGDGTRARAPGGRAVGTSGGITVEYAPHAGGACRMYCADRRSCFRPHRREQ